MKKKFQSSWYERNLFGLQLMTNEWGTVLKERERRLLNYKAFGFDPANKEILKVNKKMVSCRLLSMCDLMGWNMG